MSGEDKKYIETIKSDLDGKPNYDDAAEQADHLERNHAQDITNVWISMLIDDLSGQNQSKALKDLGTIKTKLSK